MIVTVHRCTLNALFGAKIVILESKARVVMGTRSQIDRTKPRHEAISRAALVVVAASLLFSALPSASPNPLAHSHPSSLLGSPPSPAPSSHGSPLSLHAHTHTRHTPSPPPSHSSCPSRQRRSSASISRSMVASTSCPCDSAKKLRSCRGPTLPSPQSAREEMVEGVSCQQPSGGPAGRTDDTRHPTTQLTRRRRGVRA